MHFFSILQVVKNFSHNNGYTSHLYNIVYLYLTAAANGTNMTVFKSSTGMNETHTLQAAGDFFTLSTREGEVMHIVTTGPVIATQYSQSGNTEDAHGAILTVSHTHLHTQESEFPSP